MRLVGLILFLSFSEAQDLQVKYVSAYTIDFDSRPRKFDLEFESFGINVLVDKKSHLYIKETTIGWSNELQDKGFKFDNPHAKGACGCKTSFMIDMPQEEQRVPSWMS